MPDIKVTTKINKPPRLVYDILKEPNKFPLFMKDAKKIDVIRMALGNAIITKWAVDIDGTPIEWTEEDLYNDKEKRIKFRMVDGDLKKYEGEWTLSPVKGGSRISLSIQLEWGIPNFEKYIGSILENKLCRSMRSMVWLIRKRANKGM